MTAKNRGYSEIERRFLVRRFPDNLEQYERHEIKTGYFFIRDGSLFRVRTVDAEDDGCTMAFKGAGDIERSEIPFLIDKKTFALLWAQTLPENRSEKTRYNIPWNWKIIELNLYHGNLEGFVNAEIELASRREKLSQLPDWLGREITRDERLTNNLTNREYVLNTVRRLRRRGESV